MITDRDIYAPGETVTANISFTNIYDKAFTVKPFPPTVLVEKLDTGLPVFPVVASFPGTEEERLLQTNESVNWSVSWGQRDEAGNQVSPGRYIFALEFSTVRNGQVTQWGADESIIKIEATQE
jgi:hypothetical protein